jgi:DNA-binding protein HU-beta
MPLTQSQLVGEIADRAGLSKTDTKAVLEALEEVVLDQLADAEKVKIGGVVQLTVRVKEATKARKGRNPATGEEITISAMAKSALPSVAAARRRLAA